MRSQVGFGPVNIQYGNSAFFTAEFFNSDGNLTVPSGATLSLDYTNILNAAQTDTIAMVENNSFYNATWSSTNAGIGLATWYVFITGFSTAAQTGIIRVIEP